LSIRQDQASSVHSAASERRRRFLTLIAIWQLLSVVVAGYLLMWFLAVTYMTYSEQEYFGLGSLWGPEALRAYAVELALGLGYIVPALAGAVGLLRTREWGRKLSSVHALLSLILIPVGTVPGALALRYLLRPDVKEHFQG
jgi:hypothetical protein